MRFQGFIGPSYTLRSVNVDAQRCINLYPEPNELGTGKEGEISSLVGTPGLKLLATLPTQPVRGTYTDSGGQLWVVSGNDLYKMSSTWGATVIGTVLTNTGPVCFSDNGIEVVLVDGTYGYSWTIGSGASFAQITDSNFLGASQVTFMDGYLIFNKPNSQQFYITPLNAVTPLDGTQVGSAEAWPDDLVGLVSLQENLYLFSERHLEIFYDSGNNSFPFQRIQGAVSEFGCAAAFSIQKIQNAVYWLGRDADGRGVVYRGQGLQPQRISTFAVETVMQELGDLSTARAWSYQASGHFFYCLNLPGASSTWVFDTTTSLWHERASLVSGAYHRHLADCHAFAYETHVVGDYSSGNLYALDPNTHTDNGAPIRWERAAPHVAKDMVRMFHGSFQLDLETGVGLDGIAQGVNPQAVLQWSDDGGHSWSNEHWTSFGRIGARKTRAIWRRLGTSRDRVYRVWGTDPVGITLIGAELDVSGGAS